MFARIHPSAELEALASAQGGVVTRAQAEWSGLSRNVQDRLVREARWQRLQPGVLFVHTQDPDWNALAWAGVLIAGDRARVGGEAAAFLHGLTAKEPRDIVIWHNGAVRSRDPWHFRRDIAGQREPRTVGSPPRTSINDTVIDLCDSRLRLSNLTPMHWLSTAVQKRRATPAGLRRALASRRLFGNRPLVAALLADVASGAESPLEIRYLRDVERAHELPRGTRQARAIIAGRQAFRDIRYEPFGVLVELDGQLGHAGSERFRDYRRDNAALMGGESTMRFGWADVTGAPCGVAAQVAELLIRRGWGGYPARCRSC